MEALDEAGLPKSVIIQMATSRAAKMLKISKEVGTISVGKEADLLVLEKNPLQDIHSLRHIRWTIKDGVMKSPTEWMSYK